MLSLARALGARLTVTGCLQVSNMGKKQFYAVVRGKRPGLYRSWAECSSQVKSYPGNLFKGFASEADAVQYLANHNVAVPTSPELGGASAAAQPVNAASQRTESSAQVRIRSLDATGPSKACVCSRELVNLAKGDSL